MRWSLSQIFLALIKVDLDNPEDRERAEAITNANISDDEPEAESQGDLEAVPGI